MNKSRLIILTLEMLFKLNYDGVKAVYNKVAAYYSYSCYESYRNKGRAIDKESVNLVKKAIVNI